MSAAAPFFTPHPTPRVVVGSGVVIIPGTAGWCMQLSNSTASGRGATNTAPPATHYVHASLLLLQFPQPVLCRRCPPRVSFSSAYPPTYVHEHQPQQQWVPAVTRTNGSRKRGGKTPNKQKNKRQPRAKYKGPGKNVKK